MYRGMQKICFWHFFCIFLCGHAINKWIGKMMTKNDINIPQDLSQLSEGNMLEIAFKLIELVPGAGGILPQTSAEWAIGNAQIFSGFEAFIALTFITMVVAFGLPSFVQYIRNSFISKRTRNKA